MNFSFGLAARRAPPVSCLDNGINFRSNFNHFQCITVQRVDESISTSLESIFGPPRRAQLKETPVANEPLVI